MNKIYSLKYSSRFDSVIPVPEFCHRKTKSAVRTCHAGLLLTSLFFGSPIAYASTVSSEIPYQTFRDFAENKGEFSPGARDIRIYKKNGELAGELNKAPMPDFSSVKFGNAISTLISPQYIVSVKHNQSHIGYKSISFGSGNNRYRMVERNDHPSMDFHVPRLNKLVTEVVPVSVTSAGTANNVYANKDRFPIFYRVGSGDQYIKDKNGKLTFINHAYSYLTGGTVGSPRAYKNGEMVTSKTAYTFNLEQGPLATHGRPGDSGSPLFAYDATQHAWVLVGTMSSATVVGNNWTVIPTDVVNRIRLDDSDAVVTSSAEKEPLKWTFNKNDGTGSLKQGDVVYMMHGQKNNDLSTGKSLTFLGDNGHILLENSVNQGAGALTFDDNYIVSTKNNSSWQGAGLDIAQGKEVTWQVNGVRGDNLHKIGAGTLKIEGNGVNEGGLKVGDGTVILSQKPDNNGRTQAFSSVNIASGRPTVVLSDTNQVNPDNISWGFRGGVLDLNGNDILFHKINVEDNGAFITNTGNKTSLLKIYPDTAKINNWYENQVSGGGKGFLYKNVNEYSHTDDYFIQRNERYTYGIPSDYSNNDDWEFVGHDERAAKKQALRRMPKDNFIYHGNLIGNIDVRTDTSGSTGDIAFDGNIHIPGRDFSQSGGLLIFQGHPVIHAYDNKITSNKIFSLGDSSVRTQPVSFNQSDWENRAFILKRLNLNNADFHLARNAFMLGDITANSSTVTLGSQALWIDLKDGSGEKENIKEGVSVATNGSDMSDYHGNVTLKEQSVLDIREKFSGSIMANNSAVSVASRQAELSGYSLFRRTPLRLQNGARLTARDGLWSDSSVSINPGASLTLSAAPGVVVPDSYIPTEYRVQSFVLSGTDAGLQIRPWTYVSGNIEASGSASITVGGDPVGAGLDKNLPFSSWLLSSHLRDYRNVWQGRVEAEHGRLSLTSSDWRMSGNSQVHDMKISDSRASISGFGFSHLAVDNLMSDQSSFVLRTDLKNSDKITISQHAEGRDNTLFVNYLRKPSGKNSLNIPLVSAPAGTNPAMFKAAEQATGFSQVTPRIRTEEKDGVTRWVLDGFHVAPNKNVTRSANSFLGTGKQNFLTEVNNLNKRMGDLRDTQGDDGLWVRVMNGAGSGDAGYSDRYTHFQFGFDKKHRLNDADLFTGVLMSHTDSHASSSEFSGETRSLGGGLYTSLMLDSGVYVDLIGKYVHHNNDYTARFIGSGKQDYATHSWYAGMEAGYRYRLSGDMYVEPQAELVYGAVSSSRFSWNADGMNMSMTNKHYNPLTGRTGVAFGKTFTGKDWQVTARAGVDYQFDLVSNGETALRDVTGEHRFTREKDSRMLYNIGVNARMNDNVRFGIELEQSAFGKYNVDHAINANFRYMF